MSTTVLTVRVAPEVSKRLSKLAQATRRSKSFLAAEAIEEYLAVQEWQVQAILDGLEASDRDEGTDFEQVKQSWERKLGERKLAGEEA